MVIFDKKVLILLNYDYFEQNYQVKNSEKFLR